MPRPVVPPRSPALSRRGLLALAAAGAGAALSGCTGAPGVSPGSGSTLVVTPSPVGSPDRLLLESALARATSLLGATQQLGDRRRRLGRRLAPLRALHEDQVLSLIHISEPTRPY
mgnify:CR=1 FL=1